MKQLMVGAAVAKCPRRVVPGPACSNLPINNLLRTIYSIAHAAIDVRKIRLKSVPVMNDGALRRGVTSLLVP